jgi:hypothetical protein
MPTFRNTLSVPASQAVRTPLNRPAESIQQSEQRKFEIKSSSVSFQNSYYSKVAHIFPNMSSKPFNAGIKSL